MKQFIDFLPIVAFFGVYVVADIYTATAALMIAAAAQLVFFKLKGWQIGRQMWLVFWVAMVFGTMTLVFRNPLFIQWRPSVVNWVMAIALVGSRFVGTGNHIQRLLGKVLTLPAQAWRALTWGWAFVFALSGAVNLYVAYQFSEQVWVAYKLASAFVVPVLLVLGSGGYLAATKQLPALPTERRQEAEAKDGGAS